MNNGWDGIGPFNANACSSSEISEDCRGVLREKSKWLSLISAVTIPWIEGLESGRMGFVSKGCWGREIDTGNNESLGVLSSEELQNLAARVEGTIVTKIF